LGRISICILLAAAVFVCFMPSLRNGFTGYDDPEYVTENSHVNAGLSWKNVEWAFTTAHASNWHPLTWISHQLDCTLFGFAPAGHHLTSLLLHVANTLVLFLWLSGLTGWKWRSAFVAAVFGLHPLHVESVAWVAERKDVLSAFFGLLTLLAYTAYVKKGGLWRYVLVAALFGASLLSKPMLMTLPLLLVLVDWWPLQRTRWAEKLPLLAMAALSGMATVWAQRAGGSVVALEQLPLALRIENAAVSYIRYGWKTVWPGGLAAFYPFPFHGIAAWAWVASVLALIAISCAVFAARRQHPWLALGWCWYGLTLLPVIGIVQVGLQSMADRYMYVPMIGLLIAVTWEADRFRGPWSRYAAPALLAACAVVTWRQAPYWHDGVTLFKHAIEVTHDNFVAHDNLGVELDRRGLFDEALAEYRETLRIKPGDRHGEANYAQASFAKGERLFESGRPAEALASFREGLRYRPRDALARTQVGKILTERHELVPAIAELRMATEIDPRLSAAHLSLGVALAWSGKPAEAAQAFAEAARGDPSNVEARYNYGLMMAALGRHAEALDAFDLVLRLKPDFGPAHAARAEAFAALGRYDEAWRDMIEARSAHAEVDPGVAARIAARVRR
jgi:protein O-mannosyl-transferase